MKPDLPEIRRHEGTLVPGPFATLLWDENSSKVWPPADPK